MKYSELQPGDHFRIKREHYDTEYVKCEFGFYEYEEPSKLYRRLNGCTVVKTIIE